MKRVLNLFVIILLFGCVAIEPHKIYVVSHRVPNAPSFIVLPHSTDQMQAMCSEYAEGALIAAGVKVIILPVGGGIETIDDVDYVVTTNCATGYSKFGGTYIDGINVRIIKDGTGEILSSFVTYTDVIYEDVYGALKAVGVPVK